MKRYKDKVKRQAKQLEASTKACEDRTQELHTAQALLRKRQAEEVLGDDADSKLHSPAVSPQQGPLRVSALASSTDTPEAQHGNKHGAGSGDASPFASRPEQAASKQGVDKDENGVELRPRGEEQQGSGRDQQVSSAKPARRGAEKSASSSPSYTAKLPCRNGDGAVVSSVSSEVLMWQV